MPIDTTALNPSPSMTFRTCSMTPDQSMVVAYWNLPVGSRLAAVLTPEEKRRLALALRTAEEQLEWRVPAVARAGRDGVHAGYAADVPAGGIVFLVAAGKHCLTTTLRVQQGRTLSAGVVELCAEARERVGRQLELSEALAFVRQMVTQFGTAPAQTRREAPGLDTVMLLGMMLASLPDTFRAGLVDDLEDMRSRAVCPALVVLFGKASGGKDKFSAAGPLVIPLAPYL